MEMTAEQVLSWLAETEDWPQTLDPDWDHGCPCFGIQTSDGVLIRGHCWRVCRDCEYQGIHVWGSEDRELLERLARAFKVKLDAQRWYNPYELKVGVPAKD